MRSIKKITAVFLILSLIFLSACGSGMPENKVHSADDLHGRTVGVLSGSISERAVMTVTEKDADTKLCYSASDLAANLISGAVDCAAVEAHQVKEVLNAARGIKRLSSPMLTEEYCLAAARENADLIDDINAVLRSLKKDGTLENIENAFKSGGTYEYTPTTPKENYRATLKVAVVPGNLPYCFVDGSGNLTGIDVVIATIICDKLGCGMELTDTTNSRLMEMVSSGIVHFGAGCITATPENEAITSISSAYASTQHILIVRK